VTLSQFINQASYRNMVHLGTSIIMILIIATAMGRKHHNEDEESSAEHVERLKHVSGDEKFKYVSAKGNALAAIDNKGVIKVYQNGNWMSLPTVPGETIGSVGVSPDGWHYMTTDLGKNYRYNANSGAWDYLLWASCTQATAMNKDLVMYRCWNSGGQMFKIQNGDTRGTGVHVSDTPKEGGDGVVGQINWVSVGSDGETWIVARDGQVYRKNPAANIWDAMPIMNAVNLDVENLRRAIVTTKFGNAYIWDGKSFTRSTTQGFVKQATINKNNAFYLDELQNLYSD